MAKMSADFIKAFRKDLEKMEGVTTASAPPRYWYSLGNYVLNRIVSGSFKKGIPQGRVTDLAGPSGSGKSFFAANLIAAAQREGASILVVDSEGALTDDFVEKIGVDCSREDYFYSRVKTIPQASRVISRYIQSYQNDIGTGVDEPHVLIVLDSLDMLVTETELEHFASGITKGDQGQKNRQLKAMLRTFVQAISDLNISIVCTSQVYQNQNLLNGEGLWIVSEAVKYACSQIVLIQKRKLKDESKGAKAGDVAGVRMICEGYKTRFTKPYQKVEIEVPYDEGMDPLSGLIDVAKKVGVIEQRGSYYQLAGSTEKWYAKDIGPYVEQIIDALEAQTSVFLDADGEIDTTDDGPTVEERLIAMHSKPAEE
jgi:RecA/RadA recombinase